MKISLLIISCCVITASNSFAAFPVSEKTETVIKSKTKKKITKIVSDKSEKETNDIIINNNLNHSNNTTTITEITPSNQEEIKSHDASINIEGNKNNGGDNQLVALLLAIFLGGLGIHRFYLGYIWQGVVQLLTGGGLGIWCIIDIIRIAIGDLKPKNKNYRKTL